ncbi:MAG: MBL fold metallo-hydrolase [Bacillota bacterium]
MVEQLLKDIYVIKVPLPGNPLKDINCYVIKGRERNLLIDTGFNMPVCYEALKAGLEELNIDMENTDIFLTHLHSDHTGLAPSIASDQSKVYMGETDSKIQKRFFKSEYWDLINDKFLMLGFPQWELDENRSKNPATAFLPARPIEFTTVREGTVIELGNYRLKCLDTPGHTPGHVCLYEEEHKILFSGDHIIFDITPNITSWLDVENPLALYFESLKKIKKLDIEFTFSAHRKAMGSCHERIDELIQHHQARINEVYQIVKNHGGLTAYHIASKMTWSIRAKNWVEFPISQKWFAVGEASSHLDYLLCEGVVERKLVNGEYLHYCLKDNYKI